MKLGLFNMNAGPCSWPAEAQRIARLAEELGYESLWAGEHVVAPSPRVPPSPIEPTTRMLDPLIALAYLASVTRHVKLGTGIIILPQRQPAVLAKQVASLDVLSDGRLLLGLGVGYLEPEFRALGVPLAGRGSRSDEYLEAMQALWGMEHPEYHGQHVDFAGVDAYPRPLQAGGPPVVIGGHTAPAYRRAVARGHGWYGFALSPEQTGDAIRSLATAAGEVDRPEALGQLEISVTPRGPVDRSVAAQYQDLGVDRLILLPPGGLDADALAAFVGQHAPVELLG